MESSWFAIAGKNTALSRAELKAVLPHFATAEGAIFSVADEVLEIKGTFPAPTDLNRLGGIVKAGRVIAEVPYGQLLSTLEELGVAIDASRYDIGLSAYGVGWNARQLTRLALELKKRLRREGKPVRMIIPTEGTIVSAVVAEKQLMAKGGREFILVKKNDRVIVGETGWVHQFEEWGAREFGKASVDTERGLLPQKLARIMVNLTGLKLGPDVTIYDPFCGSGVVLMEAVALQCRIFGSDIDPKAVAATKQNLKLPSESSVIWPADARLATVPPSLKESRGAIVTEPYLGPAWRGHPSVPEIERALTDLDTLYSQSLQRWRPALRNGTPIVMVLPVIFGRPLYPRIVDRLKRFGYSALADAIRYERSDQFVTRDIVRLVAS